MACSQVLIVIPEIMINIVEIAILILNFWSIVVIFWSNWRNAFESYLLIISPILAQNFWKLQANLAKLIIILKIHYNSEKISNFQTYFSVIFHAKSKSSHVKREFSVSIPSHVKSGILTILNNRSWHRRSGH